MTNDHSMAEQLSEGLANTRTFIGRSNSNNNNNSFRVSNIRVSNRTLIYNVCPEAALT